MFFTKHQTSFLSMLRFQYFAFLILCSLKFEETDTSCVLYIKSLTEIVNGIMWIKFVQSFYVIPFP